MKHVLPKSPKNSVKLWRTCNFLRGMVPVITINSSNYHDYVIRNGQFIGEFEQMYRNIEDPWYSVKKVDSLENDLFLALLGHVAPPSARVLDVGCGLGALSARIRQELPEGEVYACDVSETAIEKSQRSHPGIYFFVHDLKQIEFMPLELDSFDVIVMAQLIWYVLPSLKEILSHSYRLLKSEGHLIVLQQFYHPDDQKYGKGIIEIPADLIRLVRAVGFRIEQDIYINRERPQNLILWAVKESKEQKR